MNDSSHFEFELLPTGAKRIVVDGKDITRNVRSVTIHAELGKATRATIEYICIEVTAIGDLAQRYAPGELP